MGTAQSILIASPDSNSQISTVYALRSLQGAPLTCDVTSRVN